MGLIGRAVALYRERRLSTLLRKLLPYAYQQLWPYLPEDRYILKNGIVSSERTRITDRFLPGYITKYTPSDIHDYEAQYVKCIRDYVEAGERSFSSVEVKVSLPLLQRSKFNQAGQ